MDLKQMKELMAAMEKAGLKKLTIKEKTGFEIHMERHDEAAHHAPAPAMAYPSFYTAAPMHMKEMEHHGRPHRESATAEAPPKVEEGKFVLSPMVGTYYASPSPDDPHFVKVGDRVDENSVLCIIEAMKVMNEVKAGVSGTVAEILIDNAHPVEFGTKLFRIV